MLFPFVLLLLLIYFCHTHITMSFPLLLREWFNHCLWLTTSIFFLFSHSLFFLSLSVFFFFDFYVTLFFLIFLLLFFLTFSYLLLSIISCACLSSPLPTMHSQGPFILPAVISFTILPLNYFCLGVGVLPKPPTGLSIAQPSPLPYASSATFHS